MVLHNLFFLLLTASVYFTLAPFVENRLQQAQARETSLILDSFRHMTPEHGEELLRDYDLPAERASERAAVYRAAARLRPAHRLRGRLRFASPGPFLFPTGSCRYLAAQPIE